MLWLIFVFSIGLGPTNIQGGGQSIPLQYWATMGKYLSINCMISIRELNILLPTLLLLFKSKMIFTILYVAMRETIYKLWYAANLKQINHFVLHWISILPPKICMNICNNLILLIVSLYNIVRILYAQKILYSNNIYKNRNINRNRNIWANYYSNYNSNSNNNININRI